MRERGTGRLFLRGRVWWAQYYSHGCQIRISTEETDEKKAGKVLKRKVAEVEIGTHVDLRHVTYENLCRAYYLDYEAQGRKSLKRDGEGNPYNDAAKRLDLFFSGFRANEIDAEQIKRFAREQREKGLSNASINRSVSALRRMFTLAREEGKLRNLPYFPMLRENPPRKGFFEKADYEALSAELPDYARLPLALGYFTGMRKSEVLGLRWEQVDFLKGTITLYAGETKNGDGRVIPIVPQLRVLLRERYAARERACPYVCYRLDRRGHTVRIKGLRKVWESRCVKLGLGKMEPVVDPATGEVLYDKPRSDRRSAKPKVKMTYVGKTFHDLRRSAVRFLVRAGVPEKVAMGISGHKTRSVFDRYNIVSGSDLDAAALKMADYYEREKVGDNSGTMDTEAPQAGSLVN
jgi:integrase